MHVCMCVCLYKYQRGQEDILGFKTLSELHLPAPSPSFLTLSPVCGQSSRFCAHHIQKDGATFVWMKKKKIGSSNEIVDEKIKNETKGD